jgi:hypothetical protein
MSGQPPSPSAGQPKLLDAAWRSYLKMVMPANAGANQVVETRRAFYAGAAAFYSSIMLMLDPGAEATDADMEKMTALAQELQDHADGLRIGTR